MFGKQYSNATQAFENLYQVISSLGEPWINTKAIFNVNFSLLNPKEKVITTPERKFKISYAEQEYSWYKSANRDAYQISEVAKIWKQMMIPRTTEVNSNYGYFWQLNNQLDRVIQELKTNPQSRRAVLIHYDLHELDRYKYDTPCNLVLNFYIKKNKLHLSIFARSIDLWYGYGNDQYTFAKLMEEVSNLLNIEIGEMHWSIVNLHLYENHLNKIV